MSKRILALTVLAAAFIAGPAAATTTISVTYNYDGVITDCNPDICSLVPVFTDDPVTGEITIEVDKTTGDFVLPDPFLDFDFLVGGVIPVVPPNPDGVIMTGSGNVDVGGAFGFTSGGLSGDFVGGTLGGLGGNVFIDLLTGGMTVTVGFGTVFVASVEGTFTPKPIVPIPAAVWLMGSALMGLAGLRRRKTA
ncbi:MAG: VPLPA-CTERM sorting domain-containing protein [Gammaproteobacteria bacterium]|nr:VPLPA-CTERM sorting domain-containing protein [Gammaproteobacteria bacterium]